MTQKWLKLHISKIIKSNQNGTFVERFICWKWYYRTLLYYVKYDFVQNCMIFYTYRFVQRNSPWRLLIIMLHNLGSISMLHNLCFIIRYGTSWSNMDSPILIGFDHLVNNLLDWTFEALYFKVTVFQVPALFPSLEWNFRNISSTKQCYRVLWVYFCRAL